MNAKSLSGKPMNAIGRKIAETAGLGLAVMGLTGLGLAGLALAPGTALAQDELHSMGASLFGENEVGHEGAGADAGGDFNGQINMAAGTLCYFIEVYGLDEVTAAHIHKGEEGENGPPVVVLQTEGADVDEVCVEVAAEVLADMARHEDRYYVNVHTAAYPAGAIRGQLGS